MAQSLADFNRKLELVAKELDGGTGRERMARVGKQTEGDVNDAVRGTLGDQSMSGWTRSNPATIAGASRVIGDGAVFVSAGKASGQMRVLQSGRNQGGFGGPAAPGRTTRTRKGGGSYVTARKAKRWNGRTQGKGTWDAAADLMAERVPARVAKEVHRALGKHLREG